MNRSIKWVVGHAYIPLAFLIYVLLHQIGISEFWVFYGGTGLLILMNHLLEQLMPWEKTWRHADDQLVNEVGHTLVSAMLGHSLGRLLAVTLVGAVVVASPASGAQWWPSRLPMVVQVVLAFLIWDLAIYCNHRLMHTLTWRFHALHHKLRRLTWLNSGYGHPLQFVMTSLFGLGALYLCGLPREVAMYTAYMTFALNFLPHANIDMEMGLLNYIFATPRVHRWHHIHGDGGQVNFGMQLIVWDIVFGTFKMPKDEPRPEWLGDVTPHAAGFFAQWLEPFMPAKFKSRWATIPATRQSFALRKSLIRPQ